MQEASHTSEFLPLRQLIGDRAAAVALLSAGCAPFGLAPALAVFLGGMAVVLPEILQYMAACTLLGRRLSAGSAAFRARSIHLAKALLTVALVAALVPGLHAAGVGGSWLVLGMLAAFAGHIGLLLRRRA